jgi:DNA-binding transcriptional LysR family regulator
MQYTLKQLRYFAAAAEEGSVTAAAKTIRVSQPSISEAIAHLEEAFDLQLFVRHHARGLALTTAGQRLLVEARSLLAHAGDLSQSVGGLADKLAGDLEVGCFITFAPMLMPALLGAFAARFPDIRVRLHEDHTAALLEGLRYRHPRSPTIWSRPDIAFEPLAEVPFHVVLPAARLRRGARPFRKDPADEPLVLLDIPRAATPVDLLRPGIAAPRRP